MKKTVKFNARFTQSESDRIDAMAAKLGVKKCQVLLRGLAALEDAMEFESIDAVLRHVEPARY